jgi:hypothetical protein
MEPEGSSPCSQEPAAGPYSSQINPSVYTAQKYKLYCWQS